MNPIDLEKYQRVTADLISASEAARIKGVNESSVRKAVRTKRLFGYKVGPTRLVSRREVEAWVIVGHRAKKERDVKCQEEPR